MSTTCRVSTNPRSPGPGSSPLAVPTSRDWPRTPGASVAGTGSQTPIPRAGPPPPSRPTQRAHLAPSLRTARAAALQPRDHAHRPDRKEGRGRPRPQRRVGRLCRRSDPARQLCPAVEPTICRLRVTELDMVARGLETEQGRVCINKGKMRWLKHEVSRGPVRGGWIRGAGP